MRIIDAQSMGVFVLDGRSKVQFWNQWTENWSGIPADKIIGKDFISFFSKLAASDFSKAIDQVFSAKKEIIWSQPIDPERVDLLEQAMNGARSETPLHTITLSPFEVEENHLYCLIQLTQAPYSTAAPKPETSSQQIQHITTHLDQSNEALIVIDTGNVICSANTPLSDLFGYPPEQLSGKPLRLLFPELELDVSSTRSAEQLVEGVNALGDTLSISLSLFSIADSQQKALICRQTSEFRIKNDIFAHQHEILSSIYKNTADGIILIGNDGYIEQVNPIGREILGIAETSDLHDYIDDVMILEDVSGKHKLSPPVEAMERGTVVEILGDLFVKTPGREPEPIAITAIPLRNQLNKIIGCVAIFRSVSEARRVSNRLTWQSSHDALTQLPNRRHLEKELLQAIDEVRINHALHHTLLYIDLYNFSVINDTSGHNAGDELLRQFARLLEKHFDTNDVVARIGNDEFAVLIRDKSIEQARELADDLLEEVKSFSFPWDEKRLKIGVSIGAKVIDQDVTSEIDVLVAAGTSCAAAKESGRNRVNFQYRSKDIAYRKSVAEWIPKISEALEEKRFELFCQPIVPLGEKKESIRHFEVLARMRNRRGDLVLPGKFIPAAEHYGLIEDIDKWVLDSVFSYQQKCAARGLPLSKFSINLSGKSIGDENLRTHILDNFKRTGLDPHLFQFEITETAAIRNFDRAMDLIHALKAEGCYFSLDDFGSGLSSLGYLKELPVDYLKIDGSFIKSMELSEIDYSMISTINHLGHIMGIATIAECVETPSQFTMLKEIGIDYAQGYLFSRPQPIANFEKEGSLTHIDKLLQ